MNATVTSTNTTEVVTLQTKIDEGYALLEKLTNEAANLEKKYAAVKAKIAETEASITCFEVELERSKKNEPVGVYRFALPDGQELALNAYEYPDMPGKYYILLGGETAVDASKVALNKNSAPSVKPAKPKTETAKPKPKTESKPKTETAKPKTETAKPTASELISEILKEKGADATKIPEKQTDSSVKISFNKEKKGIELTFSGKPSPEVLSALKANGFRWSKWQKIWYSQKNEKTVAFAKSLTEKVSEIPEKSAEKVFEKSEKSQDKVPEKSKNSPVGNANKKDPTPDVDTAKKIGVLSDLMKCAENAKKDKKSDDQPKEALAIARERKAKCAEAEKTCKTKRVYEKDGKVVKVEYLDENGKVFCTNDKDFTYKK